MGKWENGKIGKCEGEAFIRRVSFSLERRFGWAIK
jgi:hypothetical protein